jgi:hypothetical protein
VRVAIFEKLSERKMRLKWESRYSKAEIVREKGQFLLSNIATPTSSVSSSLAISAVELFEKQTTNIAIFEKLSERKMRLKWESRYSKAEIVREKGGLEVRIGRSTI